MAVVELKSNCYEIASALLRQHAPKLASRACTIRTSAQSVPTSHVNQPPPVTLTLQVADVVAEGVLPPPVFFVTVLPPFNYRLGASPAIVQAASEWLFSSHAHGHGHAHAHGQAHGHGHGHGQRSRSHAALVALLAGDDFFSSAY